MASAVAVIVVFVLIAAAATVVFAQDPNNQTFGRYGPPGPISSWPVAWTDTCPSVGFLGMRLPVLGEKTTDVAMVAPPGGTMPNSSLGQIYARIVSSASFKNASAGFEWVTIFWGLQEAGPVVSLSEYVIGQFILISGGRPDPYISFGIIQADYSLETGAVSIQTGIGASCGAG